MAAGFNQVKSKILIYIYIYISLGSNETVNVIIKMQKQGAMTLISIIAVCARHHC